MYGTASRWLLLGLIGWGGCNAEKTAFSGPPVAAMPDTTLNILTPAEQAQGWELLFDGQTAAAWRGFRQDALPEAWQVEAGTLALVPGRGEGGDIITKQLYARFELRLEWCLEPGGNSGLFFHVSEDHDRIWHTGPEMQVLDDAGHRDGLLPTHRAGANYDLHPPSVDATRPVGQWNEVRLLVDTPHVEHWLNGQKIVEYELWSDDWNARVAASKFTDHPDYGRKGTGHIALQDHGDRVWYRNIRIRRL
jgi:hypothetical protein